LMDLGATICLPNGKPLCDKCPVMHLCKAFHQDQVMNIPVKPPKKQRRIEERTILLLEYQDRFAIRKRSDKGLLAGLWELPSVDGKLNEQALRDALAELDIKEASVKTMGEAKHIFSHIEWHMLGYHVKLENHPPKLLEETPYIWADRTDISRNYALPNAFSAFTKEWRNTQEE